MNPPIDAVLGREAERPPWGRRPLCGGGAAASCDAFDDERRTVQRAAARDSAGRLTCGRDALVGLMPASAARRRFTRFAALHVQLALLERAEARGATKPRHRVRRKRALDRTTGHERAFARVARAERARFDAATDRWGGKRTARRSPTRTIAHLFARVANAVTAAGAGGVKVQRCSAPRRKLIGRLSPKVFVRFDRFQQRVERWPFFDLTSDEVNYSGFRLLDVCCEISRSSKIILVLNEELSGVQVLETPVTHNFIFIHTFPDVVSSIHSHWISGSRASFGTRSHLPSRNFLLVSCLV